MRRQEHQRDRAFAHSVIDRCLYMTLSMQEEGAPPYSVPLSPVRCGEAIYFHCATEGRKLELLRKNPQVSMVFVGDTSVPPKAFTVFYECAMATGTAAEVVDGEERVDALRLLCQRYMPDDMGEFDRVLRAWDAKTSVWRVTLEELSAKCNFPQR